MNQKQEKKLRRERKKMISIFIEENKGLVLEEVMRIIVSAPLKTRLNVAFQILAKKSFQKKEERDKLLS